MRFSEAAIALSILCLVPASCFSPSMAPVSMNFVGIREGSAACSIRPRRGHLRGMLPAGRPVLTSLKNANFELSEDDDEEEEEPLQESEALTLAKELVIPVLAAVASFFLFSPLCQLVASVNTGGSELSHSVAGKLMASNVTPVIGICFATITATTLNTLRIRQEAIRTGLTSEAVQLDTLAMPVTKLCRDDVHRFRRAACLLESYSNTVAKETKTNVALSMSERKRLLVLQKQQMLALLAVVGEVDYEIKDDPMGKVIVWSRVVQFTNGIIGNIVGFRSKRRSVFLSSFPPLHWASLYLLAGCLPLNFMLAAGSALSQEASQSSGIFEDTLIRLLFSFLVGVETAILVLLNDINDPYSGAYCVREGEIFPEIADRVRARLRGIDTDTSPLATRTRKQIRKLAMTNPSDVVSFPRDWGRDETFFDDGEPSTASG